MSRYRWNDPLLAVAKLVRRQMVYVRKKCGRPIDDVTEKWLAKMPWIPDRFYSQNGIELTELEIKDRCGAQSVTRPPSQTKIWHIVDFVLSSDGVIQEAELEEIIDNSNNPIEITYAVYALVCSMGGETYSKVGQTTRVRREYQLKYEYKKNGFDTEGIKMAFVRIVGTDKMLCAQIENRIKHRMRLRFGEPVKGLECFKAPIYDAVAIAASTCAEFGYVEHALVDESFDKLI